MGKIANHKINYLLFIDILKIKITVMKSINFSINAKHMYLFILFLARSQNNRYLWSFYHFDE